MAAPFPIGAMPHNAPAPMHQQPQAPQPGAPMPQHNGAPAGFPAPMPVNTQPYRHPPAVSMNLHRQEPAEMQNVRGREPLMYRALRLEKASSDGKAGDSESDWETVHRTDKNMSQSMIRNRIEHLQRTTRSISKKKQDKNETIQLQLDRAQADLTSQDRDIRFYYKLAQFESEYRAADDQRHRDDRSARSSKKYRTHSKQSKSPKLERVAIVAYFQRMSAQPRMGGFAPVTLPQGFAYPPPTAAPLRPAPPAVDPRLNGQPKPPMPQQNIHPAPQAQSARQGSLNNVQQSGMPPMKPGSTISNSVGPAHGNVPAGPPPRLPPIKLPIRSPQVQGPMPVPNTLPQMAPTGPGSPKTPFEAGNHSPKKIVVESQPSVRDNIKVYHSSDRSSSPSDDGWSEDESEGTRPSSIGSDRSLPPRGRGRSPKRMHFDHHENVIIQDPRNTRKDVAYVVDERAPRAPHRQHVRFNSPSHRYREQSCSPKRSLRGKHQSSQEESWRVEPPRIIQAPRHGVRHVRGISTRRDESYEMRPSRSDKPLERARLDDSHCERDVRRDNDRFKHLEFDIRRRRDFKERRDDGREDDSKCADSEPRWSNERARDYMRQREPHHSFRHEERRETHRGYADR
ncbi:hypothetical protein F53441_2550 [Fusarium austroafricanum]|uniref:Uncharacterized protein n=1 Tax=Fusarium austroafricanum TaxID=2364996 RepID=A0A8H4KSR6_9HYPO|nr:hypothetical protein F53441_2550 [Fusarium austroafricanum]